MTLGNTGYCLICTVYGKWWYKFDGEWRLADPSCYGACEKILNAYRNKGLSDKEREAILQEYKPQIFEKEK